MEAIMQFFKYEHLPPSLALVSKPFAELAKSLVNDLPHNPELTVALRKLLEAKDAAVRAALYVAPQQTELPLADCKMAAEVMKLILEGRRMRERA